MEIKALIMKNKAKKLIYNIIPIAILLIMLIIVGASPNRSNESVNSRNKDIAKLDDGLLVVRNLNVGDADSALIQHNDEIGIIDTGLEDSYDEIVEEIEQTGTEDISFMILTHYDKDHIGSALRIVENYNVETIFIPDYVSEKKLYAPLMEGIGNLPNVHKLSENTTYKWNDVNIEIIVAQDDSYLEDEKNVDNNESLVCIMSYGTNRLLFTGDIEKDRIEDLIDSGINLSCDWIKIPHHGKDEKQALNLAKYTTPEYAVISTSAEVTEAVDTANALTNAGVKTYSTVNGEVITVANGIMVSSEYADSYDDNYINKMKGMMGNELGIID